MRVALLVGDSAGRECVNTRLVGWKWLLCLPDVEQDRLWPHLTAFEFCARHGHFLTRLQVRLAVGTIRSLAKAYRASMRRRTRWLVG